MQLPSIAVIVIAILAAWQVGETFRHGSIFERLRGKIEARGSFWSELISCGFCFSHWSSAFVVLLVVLHFLCVGFWENNIFIYTLLWLAIIRSSNLLNDISKKLGINRTPKSEDLLKSFEKDMEKFN